MLTNKMLTVLDLIDLMDSAEQDTLIKEAITRYSKKSIVNVEKLMSLIPSISNAQLEILDAERVKNLTGLQWAINLREMSPNKGNSSSYFAAMVPVVIALFPDGTSDHSSKAQGIFFEKFIDLYKKEFNWEEDGQWARNFGYDEYFKRLDEKIATGEV